MTRKDQNSEHLRLGRYLAGKLVGSDHIELSQQQISDDLEISPKSIKQYLYRHFNGLFNTHGEETLSLHKNYTFEDFQEVRKILENEVSSHKER